MPDLPFYQPRQLAELQDGYRTVNPAYERLMGKYLSIRLTNEAAYEYVRHAGQARSRGTGVVLGLLQTTDFPQREQ
jgi:hypothetical protein